MTDIYQIITDKIVAQIEQGVSTYRMPWHSRQHGASELQLPRNVTGRTYLSRRQRAGAVGDGLSVRLFLANLGNLQAMARARLPGPQGRESRDGRFSGNQATSRSARRKMVATRSSVG